MLVSPWLTAACAAGFALVHLFIGHARFLDTLPRSRWLSAAGGVAVAYVFLHILPELEAEGRALARAADLPLFRYIESHVYILALLGLVVFYGLERVAQGSRGQRRERHGEDVVDDEVFWLHIASFGLYNVLVSYLLLRREDAGLWSLGLYFAAMALHFVTSDYGLRQHHERLYDGIGRWILAAAVAAGWLLGVTVHVPETAVIVLFAFLAGGVILNVLKEELPEERQSRFAAFLLGTAVYAGLMLAIEALGGIEPAGAGAAEPPRTTQGLPRP